METLKTEVRPGSNKANYFYSKSLECRVREITPLELKFRGIKKIAVKKVSLFKLNKNVFCKPRKREPKPAEKKIQPLIGNKLRDLFRFKNLKDTAQAFHTSEANLNNLNSGKAGDGLSRAYRAIIAFAEELPARKRKEVLARIDFHKNFSNT